MTCRPYFGVDNFEMAGVAMEMEKRRENSKYTKLDETLQKTCIGSAKMVVI